MIEGLDPRFTRVASMHLDALSAVDVRDRSTAADNLLATTERLVETAESDPNAAIMGAHALLHGMVSMMSRKWGVDRLDIIAAIRPMFEGPGVMPSDSGPAA